MGILKMRKLIEENDLKLFQKAAKNFLNIDYPLDYLRSSNVVAMKNRDQEIVGGFILCPSHSRSLHSIPDEKIVEEYSEKSLLEVNGLFLCKSVKSKRSNFIFWTRLWKEIVFSGKKNIIYAYSLSNTKLGAIYQVLDPKVVYRGETKLQPGMNYLEEESIETASVSFIKYAIVHRGTFLVRKLIRTRTSLSIYRPSFVSKVLAFVLIGNIK